MKKRKIITTIIALAMALTTMFALVACGPEIVEGEGGIKPEGYYEVGVDGSVLFLPSDFKKQSSSNGMSVYTFDGGNFNIVSTPIQVKAADYTESFMEDQYEMAAAMSDVEMSVEIDEFKMYKLSGLLIVFIENTTITPPGNRTVKQYQFVYDTPTRQISLTLTFTSVREGEESDIPDKILHSISI